MDTVLDIMPEVIKDRQQFEQRNQSCKIGTKPKQILKDIIQNNVYENDYQTVTRKFIYHNVPYQQCIESLEEIMEADFIPEIIQ